MILHAVGPALGALRAPEISRELARSGYRTEILLESGTRSFLGPAAFAGVADVVETPQETPEALLFAPATADILARLARGLANDPATEFYASGVRPAFVAPDLDESTAAHPAVLENLKLLRGDGCRVIGELGGDMAGAEEIATRVLGGLGGPLEGRRVLVTTGGTREPIDSVRFVGNRSSGKMGRAIAREAARRGAEVSVVAANVGGVEPGIGWTSVESVEELKEATLRLAGDTDALIMAAAVSDFAPASRVEEKIRRSSGRLTLELEATDDVLAAIRGRYPDLFVVGFAATHGDPVADAREKLTSKGIDLVVGNDISKEGSGFGADVNEVHVVGEGGERFVPRAPKEDVARAILDELAREMGEKERR